MTKEKRILIEPVDIQGIEFECPRCDVRQYVPLGKIDELTIRCPNCREEWFSGRDNADHINLSNFVGYLRSVIARPPAVKIRLQLPSEDGQ